MSEFELQPRSKWYVVVLVGVIFLAEGTRLIVTGASESWIGHQSTSWQPTTAIVTDLDFDRATVRQGRTKWLPDIRYRFDLDGKTFVGDTFHLNRAVAKTRGRSWYEREYAVGSTIQVLFDESDPTRSSVEPGNVRDGLGTIIIGSVFIPIGLVAGIGGLGVKRQSQNADQLRDEEH